jgi:hypothetical protein
VVALDNGLELGPVRHVLEVRFNRPGRYSYRAKSDANATGTVVVQGPAASGPELEVWSEGQHRMIGAFKRPAFDFLPLDAGGPRERQATRASHS